MVGVRALRIIDKKDLSMKEIDFNQLQNINGIYYEIDTQIPFTGKSKRYYESDDCDGYREITYRNGLEDGPFKTYGEDGLLLFEGSYKNEIGRAHV